MQAREGAHYNELSCRAYDCWAGVAVGGSNGFTENLGNSPEINSILDLHACAAVPCVRARVRRRDRGFERLALVRGEH